MNDEPVSASDYKDLRDMYCRELDRWVKSTVENRALRAELAEANEQITAYQLRVDNDLLRLKAAYSLAGTE